MKKTYFKPQFKVVKLHGRKFLLNGTSQTKKMVTNSKTNLGADDDFIYGGGSDGDSDAFVAR
jgi:hypothetical protein